jgi:formylglycine-generating enzyme required for sulfatase activity
LVKFQQISTSFGRVFHGGSWGYDAGGVRAAARINFSPDIRFNDLGFRLASPVQ